jgi:tRNA(Ile2) C34 agmatinyltransferase TiaS
MAKKAPTKVCPKCGKTNHARSIKCKFCHATIPVKAKSSMPRKTSGCMSEILNAAIRLVKAAGSFERARAILSELEEIKKL